MKTLIKIFTLKAAALILLASCAAAADYSGLAQGLAGEAKANGISRVALMPFTGAEGSENEARFAQEMTASGLAAQKDLEVMDQETMQAYAGSRDGWMNKLPSRARPQAFVRGAIFKSGEELTVMVKLVDARSGRVLSVKELKSMARFSEMPPVPDINWGAPVATAALPAEDFRDALNDGQPGCEGSFRSMSRINAAAVDLKARYWAHKMKEPGFALGSLSRNPGSEIRDPQVKQQFYELLTKYHSLQDLPALPSAQEKKLEQFMAREDSVVDRCGIK
ncbi:MAG: hypothetical protein HY952_00210 [Elusimicrobia bacterium]|nr:hypothetical protein [Elusimicrobiota bacterium]